MQTSRSTMIMVLILLTGLAAIVGFVMGLLTSREVDAGWFGVVGTWFGASVSALAVVLAVRVFWSEERMRRIEAARHELQLIEARQGRKREEESDASRVLLRKFTAAGSQPDGRPWTRILVTGYSALLVNGSKETISDVRFIADGMENWVRFSSVVAAGEEVPSSAERLLRIHQFETWADPHKQLRTTRARFLMHDQEWEVEGGVAGARRLGESAGPADRHVGPSSPSTGGDPSPD